MKVKKFSKWLIPYFLILVISFVIIWPQIQSHTFISGVDYYFHMSRTYETAMQIKTGHFSYFLSLFSWRHNARILNAVYGPIGGYVSGLILLLAKSWYRWGLVMSFLALFIAGSTMYCLGRYWRLRPKVNLLVSALYMLSTPLNDFVYNRTFAGFGAALIPLVFLMISEILVKKDVNPVKFAIILVIIIEIHLMTFVLSIGFLGISMLLALVLSRSRKQLLVHECESAILTIVLPFNVWGAVLEVYSSNLHHMVSTFYNSAMGTQHTNTIMGRVPNTSWLQLPTLIGMMGLILIVFTLVAWLINLRRSNYIINILMSIGLICFWLSSQWFPWRLLSHRFLIIGQVIQFPKRFLPLSLVPLYLVAGYYLSKLTRIKNLPHEISCLVLIFLCIIVSADGVSDYKTLQRSDHYYHLEVINWSGVHFMGRYNNSELKQSLYNAYPAEFIGMVEKPVSDYMPTSSAKVSHPYGMYQRTYQKRYGYKWSLASHHGENLTLNSRKSVMQTIPFAKYAHTRVVLNGSRVNPKRNQIGAMIVPLKKGFNQILVYYVPSIWYQIGIWLSILLWTGLIIYELYPNFYIKARNRLTLNGTKI